MSSEEKNRLHLDDLPDRILISILSFLPTKSAVSATLVSRRWKNLWTSVTTLELNQEKFRNRRDFMEFSDRAMLLRNGSFLESCSLLCAVFDDAPRIYKWIRTAVQCHVKKLSLRLNPPSNVVFPTCVFSCESLVKLELELLYYTLRVSSINLPNLKRLRLCTMRFADAETAENLLCCPLMEDLSLHACRWEKVRGLRPLFTPNLKFLDIEEDLEDAGEDLKVVFQADQLSSFRFGGFLLNEYRICSSSSAQLFKAEIYVRQGLNWEDVFANRCNKLVNSLTKAYELTFTERLIQGLENDLDQLDTISTLEYMTRLNLEYSRDPISIDSRTLMKIFQRCPQLNRLDIAALRNTTWMSSRPVLDPLPMCFRSHLKSINIGICTYNEESNDVITILLNSCFVLEKIDIKFVAVYGAWHGICTQEIQNKLDKRPRSSKNCKIVIRRADSTRRMYLPLLV